MDENSNTATPIFSNTTYDRLNWLAMVLLPAIGTLYFALAQFMPLPAPEAVIGSITAVDVFIGGVLKLSNKSYVASEAKYDGALIVDTSDPAVPKHSLVFDVPLEDLAAKSELTLKVTNPT